MFWSFRNPGFHIRSQHQCSDLADYIKPKPLAITLYTPNGVAIPRLDRDKLHLAQQHAQPRLPARGQGQYRVLFDYRVMVVRPSRRHQLHKLRYLPLLDRHSASTGLRAAGHDLSAGQRWP